MKTKTLFILSLLLFFIWGCERKFDYKKLSRGVNITLPDGTLGIYPVSDNAVRVKFFKGKPEGLKEFVLTSDYKVPDFQVSENSDNLKIEVENMMIKVDKSSGKIFYADQSGKIFLSEKAGSRKLVADSVMGEPCYEAKQSFKSPKDEYIYGLGQFQDGNYNLRGVTRRLTQVNSQISLPFIYSSKGYGLLWHQYGLTDFNPADNYVTLKKQEQSQADNNKLMEVTTTSGTKKVSQNQSLYQGQFKVPKDGEYSVFLDLGNMGNRHFVAIDGKTYIDQSNMWLPPTVGTLAELEAGEHQVQIICKSDNNPKLSWKLNENSTTFRSPHAKQLDYVVFYGPSADSVIASYRDLSGNVPLLPRWAYGFWQCRERYTSGKHLVNTVKEFRERNLPMDVIVQDWQYWGKHGWGVPKFDKTYYPNPSNFIEQIHDLNAHFSISIWSNPDKNSEIGQEYAKRDLYIPNSPWLDYFNPETRKRYWNTLKKNLFTHGVDSWWMDATEPENDALHGKQTHMGPGDFYRLTYPLLVSKSVYNGQRKTTFQKRVCILTRSAFLGQHRYGTINWSADIGGTWESYKRQIVAGLNYNITGMPYWTTDIGGFFRPDSQYTDKNYRELLTRWFQWGTFNPIFRVHGYQSETEPWKYGQKVENNMRKMLNLRYRLIPYIYSEAWQVTQNGSTMMRPFVMDFRDDTSALNRRFEYMFGQSFLVAPITKPNADEREVYLPRSADWYNFWTGRNFNGGQTITTAAPLDKIPLFVKAGSIVPMGKCIQYTEQKSADTMEIRIYQGSDGNFTLYEDENDNYNYEDGAYSTITFNWNDAEKVLTIGAREGSFPGMLRERQFKIIKVNKNKGSGMKTVKKYEQMVKYKGMKMMIQL